MGNCERAMIVKVPKTIQIGGHVYSVQFDPLLVDDGVYAQVNHRLQTISINPKRPSSQLFEGLIHECLHVIEHVWLRGDLNEKQTESISEGFLQLLIGWGIEMDWCDIVEK